MTKLSKLALLGSLALGGAGCEDSDSSSKEFYYLGNFRGYETAVSKFKDGSFGIGIIAPDYDWNVLRAYYNIQFSGNFDDISLTRASITDSSHSRVFLRNNSNINNKSPLFAYANPDSLKVALDSVIAQNERKEAQK